MTGSTAKTEGRLRVEKSIPKPGEPQAEPATKPVCVLGIGLPADLVLEGIEIHRPATERAVIEQIRQTGFDLMLVTAQAEEERVWNLLRLIRRHWPSLRWVLYAEQCSDALEILARSLGAVCVTADVQIITELASC